MDLFFRFGPGAGAASAGLLAIMPRSKSMVRRVIAISGSPLADWAAINDKFRAMNTSLVRKDFQNSSLFNIFVERMV